MTERENSVVVLKAKLAVKSENLVGECPVWDFRIGNLLWVDIGRSEFHAFDPKTEKYAIISLPFKCSSFCLSNIQTRFLFSFADGLYFYDHETQSIIKK